MPAPVVANYDARWGYRKFDARRYEQRRYGGPNRRWNLRLLERALARALRAVPAGGLVLDIPCGTGILEPFLRTRGLRVVGSDIGPAMLEVAHERHAALGLVRADLELPPYRLAAFDAVVCARFLMHVPAESRPRILATLAGLSHGPLVATVCHPYTWKNFGRAVRRFFGARPKRSPRLTRAELTAEVAAAGLVLEQVIPVMPVWSEVWVIVVRKAPGAQNGKDR